jgi:hypothetical protein
VLTLRELAAYAEPYDRAWEKRTDVQLDCTRLELDQFTDRLVYLARGRRRGGVKFERENFGGDDNPFSRIIRRLNTHHDHGLYTTTIEELLISLCVGKAASSIWDEMKTYIDDAFAAKHDAGGTAFLDKLAEAWRKNPNLRVTLIGHSAGSIYVQRLIEELDRRFPDSPDWKLEVLYMAPAISFARMYAGLESFRRRVRAFRVFALTKTAERKYWEVRFIYKGSLLYIVSGLCEADPDSDKPILGMQRYWSCEPPYLGVDILTITDYIGSARAVWSPTTKNANPGYQCSATVHGGFPLDSKMRGSARYILVNGF